MKSISLAILLFVSFDVSSQDFKALKIGDKVPEKIWIKIPKKQRTKLIILDFWATTCGSCISAFSKMDKLQNEFNESLQIVLVNATETTDRITARFEIMNKKRSSSRQIVIPASLPTINGDSSFRVIFPYRFVPHLVWINSERKVIGITNGENATSKHVKTVIDGGEVKMQVKDDQITNQLKKVGYLQPTQADMPAAFYSAFTPAYGVNHGNSRRIDSANNVFRIAHYNANPLDHFRELCKDSENQRRVFYEISNLNQFEEPIDSNLKDEWRKKYQFTYEIQDRLENLKSWQEKYLFDANYFFGSLFGIRAIKEKRVFKSIVLVKQKDGLLHSNKSKRAIKYNDSLISWTNQQFKYVVAFLQKQFEKNKVFQPFIDETGFQGYVDMQLSGDLMDFENVRKQLLLYGLNMIFSEREIEVLTITDKSRL